MRVYRLASGRYASNNSEGARLWGGRWNEVGTPVIHASGTKSLAALEVIAHHRMISVDYRIINISIPDSLKVEVVEVASLPADWRHEERLLLTAKMGTEWAKSVTSAVLRVPSAVMLGEFNYILNPLHAEFREILFEVPEIDEIDKRLRSGSPMRPAR